MKTFWVYLSDGSSHPVSAPTWASAVRTYEGRHPEAVVTDVRAARGGESLVEYKASSFRHVGQN